MLIRVDRVFVDDLCAHFRRSDFTAESVGGGMVEVKRVNAADTAQADRDLHMHLRVWKIANPAAHAEVVD